MIVPPEPLIYVAKEAVEVFDEVLAALRVTALEVALGERAEQQLGLVEPRGTSTARAISGQPGRAGCRTEYSVPDRKGTVIDAKPWRGSRT